MDTRLHVCLHQAALIPTAPENIYWIEFQISDNSLTKAHNSLINIKYTLDGYDIFLTSISKNINWHPIWVPSLNTRSYMLSTSSLRLVWTMDCLQISIKWNFFEVFVCRISDYYPVDGSNELVNSLSMWLANYICKYAVEGFVIIFEWLTFTAQPMLCHRCVSNTLAQYYAKENL